MWKINKSIKVYPQIAYKLVPGGKHKYQLELPRARNTTVCLRWFQQKEWYS